jgi:hypothetical protein
MKLWIEKILKIRLISRVKFHMKIINLKIIKIKFEENGIFKKIITIFNK